jgi:hypothetical protein
VTWTLPIALLSLAVAQATAERSETVTLSISPPGTMCGGLCRRFDASLDSRDLIYVEHFAFGETGNVASRYQYLAQRAGAAEFRSLLRSLRPAWEPEDRPDLFTRRLGASDAPNVMITWRNGGRQARLVTSTTAQDVYPLVRRALEALGLDETGSRRRPSR